MAMKYIQLGNNNLRIFFSGFLLSPNTTQGKYHPSLISILNILNNDRLIVI